MNKFNELLDVVYGLQNAGKIDYADCRRIIDTASAYAMENHREGVLNTVKDILDNPSNYPYIRLKMQNQ